MAQPAYGEGVRAAPVERPEAVPAFGDGERPDDVPIRRPYVPEECPGDYVPVSVEPCAPQVVVRDGFQTKEVLRVRLDEVLVVVDGGGDEYPLAARGVRDGREGRGGIDEVPFDPQVPDAERVGRATDEFGGLRVAGAAEALGSLYTSMLGFPVGIPAISSASIAFLIRRKIRSSRIRRVLRVSLSVVRGLMSKLSR